MAQSSARAFNWLTQGEAVGRAGEVVNRSQAHKTKKGREKWMVNLERKFEITSTDDWILQMTNLLFYVLRIQLHLLPASDSALVRVPNTLVLLNSKNTALPPSWAPRSFPHGHCPSGESMYSWCLFFYPISECSKSSGLHAAWSLRMNAWSKKVQNYKYKSKHKMCSERENKLQEILKMFISTTNIMKSKKWYIYFTKFLYDMTK